ncbi:MAG TPA: hypothetical protein VG713_21515 [Pirellulales bacterium]|nr:hypothetical protein [Pirellulales bacterium]
MPDPLLYVQAVAASAAVGALLLLAMVSVRRPASAARSSIACGLGLAGGVAVGCYVLRLPVAWPPANALDRLLTLVLPALLTVEAVIGAGRMSPRLAWFLRLSLAAVVGRILLHGSVYLSGPNREWSVAHAAAVLAAFVIGLATTWLLLAWLSRRSPGVSIPLALAICIQAAGVAIMLAGYLGAGAAAAAIAASLIGTTLAVRRTAGFQNPQAIISLGVVALFGLAFIGVYFGRLSLASAVTISFAPLLCWTTELPGLRVRNPWLVGALRLAIVAIPLLVVLGIAMVDFYRHTAPLLGEIHASPAGCLVNFG